MPKNDRAKDSTRSVKEADLQENSQRLIADRMLILHRWDESFDIQLFEHEDVPQRSGEAGSPFYMASVASVAE